MSAIIKLMRPRHWVKNLFVFAPLVFAGLVQSSHAAAAAAIAFGFFCLASSAVYVLNDLADLEGDRHHERKSVRRPLASGRVQPRTARILFLVLISGLLTAFAWKWDVALALLAYVGINIVYSAWWKKVAIVELFLVASGFPLRVYAGTLAIGVPLSQWMFVTVLALALFLVSVKRLREFQSPDAASARAVLEQYGSDVLKQFVQISAMASLVFYCMFTLTERPELGLTVPLVLFGFFRFLLVSERVPHGDSPTEVFLSDLPLLLTVLSWGGLVTLLVGISP